MSERPRFGLIGTGVWAQLVQAPAAAQCDIVDFTSVFGRSVAKTEAFAVQCNVQPYTDLANFLDSVDIVGICVPPEVQAQYAFATAKARRAVILEKPLALDPIEAESIAAAFMERGLPALVFFTHLLIPRTEAWIKEVSSAGGWISARVDSYSQLLRNEADPFFGTAAAWRGAAGALWDTGPHAVAILLTTLGDVSEVFAVRGIGDLKLIMLTHKAGAVSTVALTMDSAASVPKELALFGAAGKTIAPPSPQWLCDATIAYVAALRRIADALATQSPKVAPDVALGVAVTKVLAAAGRSIATGRRIVLS